MRRRTNIDKILNAPVKAQSITERFNIKEGSVFTGTWGYSMMIPAAFQVVGVTKASVKVRKIAMQNVEGDGHIGKCRPMPNVFEEDCFHRESPVFTCRVKECSFRPGVPMIHVSAPDVYCYLTENPESCNMSYDYMD